MSLKRFGLGLALVGVEVFSTLWKKYGNLLLSGDFQMPFQGLRSGFSEKPQGKVVPLGSLNLS